MCSPVLLQKVCSTASALAQNGSDNADQSNPFQAAASLILDLLFFANSKPIHRQILSWCRGLPADRFAVISHVVVRLLHDAVAASSHKGLEMQSVTLAEPMLSLLEFKPLQLSLR